jgi:2,4-dienoyl-CoA reductase-like NADH-dependent reductase (Old Yellow Enzyme family)
MDNYTAAKLTLSTLLAVRAYDVAKNISWESATSSTAYQLYRKSCKTFVDWKGPNYTPLLEDGKTRQEVPSHSKQIYSLPPLDVHECKSLTPFKIRGLTLRNRVIRAAAFDGTETHEMLKMHEGLAKGGVGMTVIAYCSVSPDGRTFEGQIVLPELEDAKKRLKPVTDACHRHGAAVCAQLTHAGSFAHRHVIHTQQVSASAVFNHAGFDFPRAANKQDIERIINDFASGAIVAVRDCGFDAVEIHCGHGYLLSQWMSPFTNIRTDEYGGSPQNRARLPCRIIRAVREALGPNVPILVKMNAQDGVYGGLELPDALIMAELFAEASADLLVVTTGFVSMNGFYMLRGTTPVEKLVTALPGAGMKFATMVFGPIAVPAVPYEDCFLRDHARAVLQRIRSNNKYQNTGVCLMGGVSSLSQMEGAMNEGFMAVQMARPLIREPDFLHRIMKEVREAKQERVTLVPWSGNNKGGEDIASSDDGADTFDVETKCIRCNSCVIASVDPLKDIGCPFRKLEDAAALQKRSSGSNNNNMLSINQTMAKQMYFPDIEDYVGSSSKM